MPRGFRGWAIFGVAQLLLTYALKLIIKLADNALMGWGDDRIAEWLGIKSPTLATAIEWAPPFILAAIVVVVVWKVAASHGVRALPGKGQPVSPPIKVEIPNRWLDEAAHKRREAMIAEMKVLWKENVDPTYQYNSQIHIVNVSKTDRVSLKLEWYQVELSNGLPPLNSGIIFSDGLKLSLGPQEETEGTFTVHLFTPYHSEGEHTLVIVDRISGGIARVRVPGRFPRL